MNFCDIKQCPAPDCHNRAGHFCQSCYGYGHGLMECFIKGIAGFPDSKDIPQDLQCKIVGCPASDKHLTKGHFCRTCRRYGHSILQCRNQVQDQVQDQEIKQYEFKCPTCRKDNIVKTNQPKVFGSTEKCCICMDESANIFLPSCGHLICDTCLPKL